MTRVITAYFVSANDSRIAMDRLLSTGVSRARVAIYDCSSDKSKSDKPSAASDNSDKGFWEAFGELPMTDEDRHAYAEGIRRGGSVLIVQANEMDFDSISEAFDDAWSVDFDTGDVVAKDLEMTIGPCMLNDLARRTGLPKDDVLARLSREFPKTVGTLHPADTIRGQQHRLDRSQYGAAPLIT